MTPRHNMQHIHISSLILHYSFNFPLLETKASIEKAIGSVTEPFSNEYLAKKELVARPACFVTQLPITDSLVFASL
jgi:hypothetical protein